jgi:hypothetical protein
LNSLGAEKMLKELRQVGNQDRLRRKIRAPPVAAIQIDLSKAAMKKVHPESRAQRSRAPGARSSVLLSIVIRPYAWYENMEVEYQPDGGFKKTGSDAPSAGAPPPGESEERAIRAGAKAIRPHILDADPVSWG